MTAMWANANESNYLLNYRSLRLLPFSLTVSLTIFCTEPLKPLVLHTPLNDRRIIIIFYLIIYFNCHYIIQFTIVCI